MKELKQFMSLILTAALSLVVSSCRDEPQKKMDTIKIGVSVYRQDDTFITSVKEYIEEAAKLKETTDNIKITVNVLDGKGNQSIQNDHIDQFISQGYDVICVNEVDRTSAYMIIDKAKAANIAVVFFNREPVAEDIKRWDKLYYVGSDPKEAGMMQGEIIIEAYAINPYKIDKNQDGKIQYVMLEGEPGHQDATIRTEYSIKTIVSAPNGLQVEKLANDTANWQRSEAIAIMGHWIDTYGSEIEVVFSNNDDMALGAIDAYLAKEITDMPLIIGIDGTKPALDAINNGTLSATVINDAKGQGYAIFDIAYALSQGKNPQLTVEGLDGHYMWLPHEKYIGKEYRAYDQ